MPLAFFWRSAMMYVYSIECERQRKGGQNENRMNRTQCAWRSCWQYCRCWRGGITSGEKSIVKGMNKLKFVYRCFIVGAVIAAGLLLSALIR